MGKWFPAVVNILAKSHFTFMLERKWDSLQSVCRRLKRKAEVKKNNNSNFKKSPYEAGLYK